MPLPRKSLISLADTPYYHCMSRCVRRAFLCGEDDMTGVNYEHRRGWVEKRLLTLAKVFAIEVCAYAVMSNHLHVVLKVNPDKARAWTNRDVATRWCMLHKGTPSIQEFVEKGDKLLEDTKHSTLQSTLAIYRQRLMDISWFMRELNEPIARRANQEDGCTGHFWEARFKSQALLDDAAVTACMAYVDLNPIRVNLASSLADSRHTSIAYRLKARAKGRAPGLLLPMADDLCPDAASLDVVSSGITLPDYLQLLHLSTQVMQSQQQEVTPLTTTCPVLHVLQISSQDWLTLCQSFEQTIGIAAGCYNSLIAFKHNTGRKRMVGLAQAAFFS